MARTFRLRRPGGIALTVADRGATWLSCEVPLPDGERRNVILARPSAEDAAADKFYLGATVGRYANRIAQARVRRDGREWQLAPNEDSRHQLHGGPGGFHSRTWQAEPLDDAAVRFSLRSPDGDQGFPGAVDVEVTYRVADLLTIEMEIVASTSAPTPLAVTNHAYFNLDGDAADIRDHQLMVNAAQYMPVDAELIPFGPPQPVTGTSFDFRESTRIGQRWLQDEQQQRAGGYDHAFLLHQGAPGVAAPAAQLTSARGDLALAIATTLPALQLYTGQQLAGIAAPHGGMYSPCAGVALEAGYLPDSPNHPQWPQPSCWLLPGAALRHVIRYSFK